jgi:hypothetical protein
MSTGPSVASQRDKSRRQRLRELPAEFLRERPVSCRHCLWDKLKWLTLPSQREIDERNGGMILCQYESTSALRYLFPHFTDLPLSRKRHHNSLRVLQHQREEM